MQKMDLNYIKNMSIAGKIAAKVLNNVIKYAQAGVTTNELDKIAHDLTLSLGAKNACLGYKGYPKTICTSLNNVLCHGVPDDIPLKGGDIINIDVTVRYKGFHGDTSATIYIDEPILPVESQTPELAPNFRNKIDALELISVAKEARDAGIKIIRPYIKVGAIGYQTYNVLKKYQNRYMPTPSIGGHGIGLKFHDKPFVPSISHFLDGEVLKPWTCLTVEPVIVDGHWAFSSHPIHNSEIETYKTISGKNACQFEHTVLVTDDGHEILTLE